MNERPDEGAQPNGGNGGSDPRDDAGMLGAHLGEETINALIDRSLAPQEAVSVRAHIDACGDCRAMFVEMRATRELLRGLPAPLPSRSFQLGPEYLNTR